MFHRGLKKLLTLFQSNQVARSQCLYSLELKTSLYHSLLLSCTIGEKAPVQGKAHNITYMRPGTPQKKRPETAPLLSLNSLVSSPTISNHSSFPDLSL